MTARVFVVQQPAVYDQTLRQFVPKVDVTPAAKFGELVFLLPPGNVRREDIPSATKALAEALATMTAEDYLLPLGDPVAMVMAASACAAAGLRTLKVLKWDKRRTEYSFYQINMGAGNDDQVAA